MRKTGVMPPKFGGGHSLKCYAPNYLSHENRTLYHQHTQIITKVDIKLNNGILQLISYIENELKQKKIFNQL